jgi:hypothetical protein
LSYTRISLAFGASGAIAIFSLTRNLPAERKKIADVPEETFEKHLKTKEPQAFYLIREQKDQAKNRERQLQKAKRRWNLKKMLKSRCSSGTGF